MSKIGEPAVTRSTQLLGVRSSGTSLKAWLQAKRFVASVALVVFSSPASAVNTVSYTYDTLGRVSQINYSDGTKTMIVKYGYDVAGNRTYVISN